MQSARGRSQLRAVRIHWKTLDGEFLSEFVIPHLEGVEISSAAYDLDVLGENTGGFELETSLE